MLVYRVEDAEGGGPYRGDNPCIGMGYRHTDSDHPSPIDDDIPCWDRPYLHCGFSSLEQFRDWFTEDDRIELQEHGFRLCAFESNIVNHGSKQIMFNRDNARLVETRDVVSLHPIPATGAPVGLLEC